MIKLLTSIVHRWLLIVGCGLVILQGRLLAAAEAPVATPANAITNLLGSAEFQPSPQHPIGYRGDGTGCYPGATHPCLSWAMHGILPTPPDRNIRWTTALHGYTLSHPIVVTMDRMLFNTWLLSVQNDCFRAPGDPFISGDKVYIRTLEGMVCIGADADAGAATPAPQ